jgi:proteasome accessory factor C
MSEANTRVIRLLDLVPFLRANPGLSLKEIANQFHMTVPELVSDLDLLMVCGLPGYTPLELIDLSTDGGYVTLREPQNLEYPRNFTESESLILRIALSALLEESPESLQSEIQALIAKLEEQISFHTSSDNMAFVPDSIRNWRRVGEEAVSKNYKVELSYRNDTKDEVSSRKISLIRQYEKEGEFHWDAWCHLVNARRTFNLRKIVSARILDEPSEIGELSGDSVPITVKIKMRTDSQFYRKHHNLLKKTNDSEVFELQIYQKEWLIRDILAAGGGATVTTPADLRSLVQMRAKEALALYR